MKTRSLFVAAVLSLAVVAARAQDVTATPTDGTQTKSPAKQSPATQSSAKAGAEESKAIPAVEATSACAAELKALRELYAAIPTDFRGIPSSRLEELAKMTYECRERLEKFLGSCKVGPAEADAHFMYARVRTSLAARERVDLLRNQKIDREEVSAKMKQYHRVSLGHCHKALELAAEENHDLSCRVRDLTADISFQLGDFDDAAEHYSTVVEKCGDVLDVGNTVVGAGRAFNEIGKTDEGIRFVRRQIKERYRNANLPFFYEVLWNLLVTAGDIDGMVAWCDEVQTVFPIRRLREGIGTVESDAYRRFLGYSGFRRGYALFARGDLGGATDAFVKHIEAMNALEAELAQSNKALPQELGIYRTRSQDVLQIIQDKVGDPPECDLDLDDMWMTPTRVRIAESRGKAVLVLFRGYGDRRSAGIFGNLDEHFGKDPENKAFAAIHYFKGTRDPLGQLEQVQDELIELRIENAAVGMDPDARNKRTFRCLRAMVGSATLMIFDRYGQLMWWMQDPREMDTKLVIAIWERLSRE